MSRATIVDLPPEEEQADTLEIEADEIQQEVEQPQEENPTVPEKYQGKSLEEVVQMHQEAEKLLGRQSSEVGELRKVVDDYINSQTQLSAPQQPVEPEDDLDYFTDPQAAVNRAIENHPKIREAEQYSAQYKNKLRWHSFKLNIQTCKKSLVMINLQTGLKPLKLGLSYL